MFTTTSISTLSAESRTTKTRAKLRPAARIALLMGLFISAAMPCQADDYTLVLGPLNGRRVPKVLGASSDQALANQYTTKDYFEWFGATHNRCWIAPGYQTMNATGGVTTQAGFDAAVAQIRANPLRQGTAGDVFIDWSGWFNPAIASENYNVNLLRSLGIELMVINTSVVSATNPLDTWGAKFKHWRSWYALVYRFASVHDVSMYEFDNEPSGSSYFSWESHWIVAADAIRKAIADVNQNFGKNLKVNICGPTTAGVYWDYTLPPPNVDFHSWGSYAWQKVQTDIYGNVDPNIWNYGMYDYHRYRNSGYTNQQEIADLRTSIATANNSPHSTIPIIITEYNTATAGSFRDNSIDTEALNHGVGMAQILQATATLGPNGLGDEGGFFIFRIAGEPSVSGTLNRLTYVSEVGNKNMGGITRGGCSFQLYARHFRGGKPLLGTTVTAGAHSERRPVAVFDKARQAYYVYFSNVNGTSATTTVDCSALDVEVGTQVTLARVGENLTGQIADLLSVNANKQITFNTPDMEAWLLWIPRGRSAAKSTTRLPAHDSYLVVGDPPTDHGSETSMKVSLHKTDTTERRLSFMQFSLTGLPAGNRYLLRYTGRNIGTDPTAREILHVYGRPGSGWTESGLTWATAPGVGRYYTNLSTGAMSTTTGLGTMIDIEDNHAGVTVGTGMGIYGKFLGPVSFSSGTYVTDYLDVTDYVESLIAAGETEVSFIFARPVRYNVNSFATNDYYTRYLFECNGRIVEIATKEATTSTQRPLLMVRETDQIIWSGAPDGNWNIATNTNWLNGLKPVSYVESAGLGPVVEFDDDPASATTVNLTTTLAPRNVLVSNSSKAYTFTGSGGISGTAGLTKTGTDKLTLANSGANTFTGSTTISEGTLQIGNDDATGSLSSTDIVNNGTLRFDRTGTLTVPGNISGSGTMIVDCPINAGTITLSGNNSFTGNVTVSSGGLRITNSSALGTTATTKTIDVRLGTVGNTHLRLDGSGGAIDLPASILFNTSNPNGAIFNEAGDNTVRGNITLTSGGGASRMTVTAGTLTLTGSIKPNTTGRSLSLFGPGNGFIPGIISDGTVATNTLALTKADTGTWTLSAANTYTGTTTVSAGLLLVNGSLHASSAVTVSGGALGGSGNIGGNVTVAAAGSLAPGASIGTLAIGGNLNVSAMSTGTGKLQFELSTPAASDKITVGGTLTIGSGTLGINDFTFTAPGSLSAGTYKLITATTRSGTLDSSKLTGTVGNFNATLSLNGNDIELTLISPFTIWQTTNGPGSTFNGDHDNDGVPNGIEYFLGGTSNTTGQTTLPAVQNTSGTLSITWTKASSYLGTYGTDFVIESSDTLTGVWTTETVGVNVTITGNQVKYTFPAGDTRRFVRLKVVGL